MCGIVGILDLKGRTPDPMMLKSMMDIIRHRGPEDEGYVLINQATSHFQTYAGPDSPEIIQKYQPVFELSEIVFPANLGLSHRRFSIIDRTSAAH
jgi:asparagine synthase (glutamine-hydrolysing)